jgi:hypothetical protein
MKRFWSYFVFYLVQWTWGVLMNIIGACVALGMLVTKHKPYRVGPYIYFRTEWDFGGLELGMFFIIGKNCDSCACHEMGHGMQNMIFGPFSCLLSIGSAIRYWYRELKYYRKDLVPPTEYDAWWFEGIATKWGEKVWSDMWQLHCFNRE